MSEELVALIAGVTLLLALSWIWWPHLQNAHRDGHRQELDGWWHDTFERSAVHSPYQWRSAADWSARLSKKRRGE